MKPIHIRLLSLMGLALHLCAPAAEWESPLRGELFKMAAHLNPRGFLCPGIIGL